MSKTQKITVEVPVALLRKSQKQTGQGVSATVRLGLELLAAAEAYERLSRLKGQVAFSIDLETMREDRT